MSQDFTLSFQTVDRDVIYTSDYTSLCDRLLLQLQNGLSAVPSIGPLKGMFGPAQFKYTFAVFLYEYKRQSLNRLFDLLTATWFSISSLIN
jgi:hypothetical protein